jgi:hypothetical protein
MILPTLFPHRPLRRSDNQHLHYGYIRRQGLDFANNILWHESGDGDGDTYTFTFGGSLVDWSHLRQAAITVTFRYGQEGANDEIKYYARLKGDSSNLVQIDKSGSWVSMSGDYASSVQTLCSSYIPAGTTNYSFLFVGILLHIRDSNIFTVIDSGLYDISVTIQRVYPTLYFAYAVPAGAISSLAGCASVQRFFVFLAGITVFGTADHYVAQGNMTTVNTSSADSTITLRAMSSITGYTSSAGSLSVPFRHASNIQVQAITIITAPGTTTVLRQTELRRAPATVLLSPRPYNYTYYYALYAPIKYAIQFVGNGGTASRGQVITSPAASNGYSSPTSPYITSTANYFYVYDETYALYPNAFSRANYGFSSWLDSTGKSYGNQGSLKNLTTTARSIVTLTANG